MARVKVDVSRAIDTSKPVDAGTYYLQIKKAESRDPKNQPEKGKAYPYIACMFEITDGPFAGRTIWQNLTTNPEDTKNGGQKNYLLANLLFVLDMVEEGSKELDFDTDELINKDVIAKVDVDSENRNEIKKFLRED